MQITANAEMSAQAGPGEAVQRTRIKVLLVVEGSADGDQVAAALDRARRLDVEMVQANGISAALDYLTRNSCEVVLLDAAFADSSGLDAVRELQAHAPDAALVVLAGEADDEGLRALQAGAQDYLIKGEISGSLLERSILYSLERKRSQAAVWRSERRYEELVNSLDGIVWEADARTVEFKFVSNQAERMLGYPVERWIDEPTFWQDHIYQDDQDWAPAFCAVATAEMRPHQFEYRMLTADGRIVWLRDIVTVLTENNRPVKLRGVMIDITDRKEQEQRYRSVFESTSDGLVVNDVQGRAVEVNPAFCAMHGYSREELIGMDLNDLHPAEELPVYKQYIDAVSTGGSFKTQGLHLHQRKDGSLFYVEVHGTHFTYNGETHMLGVVRDVTERVQAYELLEQRVDERTRELSTLLDVSHNVVSTLELRPLLRRILDQLKFVADYDAASILVQVGGELIALDSRDTPVPADFMREGESPLQRFGPIWDAIQQGNPVIIGDVRGDTAPAAAFREAAGALLDTTFSYICSWMAVPLKHRESVVGLLGLAHGQSDYYTARHAMLAGALANHAAVAIENARLYEEAQETLRSTTALAQTASRVALGGSLKSTLDDICKHVVGATGAVAAAVALLGPEGAELREARMAGAHGLPEDYVAAVNRVLAAGAPMESLQSLLRREVAIVPRLNERLYKLAAAYPEFEPVVQFVLTNPFETYVSVPMVYGDNLVGGLLAYYPAGRQVDDALVGFQIAIANQTAVAVENARLLTQMQEKAHLEERQRLARELHDSVTQELFSIGLSVRTVEMLLEREGVRSPAVSEKMADVRQLTKGALAEMRALIFELRPGALEEEGLLEAVRKHAAAVEGRQSLRVEVLADALEVPRLKPIAEEALYRIAQEALHNVVKHARATRVEVVIKAEEQHLVLRVTDDGQGFDVSKVPAGHLGLGTMGQRATALGGRYEVESKPGVGTSVVVRVPLAEWQLP